MEWIASKNTATAESAAAQFIAARLAAAIAGRGQATLAISGGRTPWGLLTRLAGHALDWKAVRLFQVDERIVAADDAARNWKHFLRTALATRIPSTNHHPMPVEIADAKQAASQYAQLLIRHCGRPPALDVVHLGIGADGHTASLFAGDALLQERQRLVGVSAIYDGHARLSMTLPVLNHAGCIVWYVTGTERKHSVSRLFAADPDIPASQVKRTHAVCFTDLEAAPAT